MRVRAERKLFILYTRAAAVALPSVKTRHLAYCVMYHT